MVIKNSVPVQTSVPVMASHSMCHHAVL